MVYGTYSYSIHGVYGTHLTSLGGPTLYGVIYLCLTKFGYSIGIQTKMDIVIDVY